MMLVEDTGIEPISIPFQGIAGMTTLAHPPYYGLSHRQAWMNSGFPSGWVGQ